MGNTRKTHPSPNAECHSCPALTSPIISIFWQVACCGVADMLRVVVTANANDQPIHPKLRMSKADLGLRFPALAPEKRRKNGARSIFCAPDKAFITAAVTCRSE
jgi:hypothetical protein